MSKLTKEQCQFYILTKKLNELNESRNCLTRPEKELRDKIITKLWDIVENYAISEMNKMLQSFGTQYSDRSDIIQEMFEIFLRQLPSYDPTYAAPITYFAPYFRQVISASIRSNHKRLTQYDANNVRKIKRIIAEYEKNGVYWTVDMLVTKTGLSPKVVKNSLLYANNATSVAIEDAEYLKSNILTPEEAYEEQEFKTVIYETIKNNTTPLEAELLYRRINENGHKNKPYEQIANETNIPLRKVRAIINEVCCRLQQNEELKNYFGCKNNYESFTKVKLQPELSDDFEEELLNDLDGLL